MKVVHFKKTVSLVFLSATAIAVIFINGCVESKTVAAKSGAQLWAENCQRCHNTPPPNAFSQEQWKTIGMHMQTRALITNNERDKIVAFLQQAN